MARGVSAEVQQFQKANPGCMTRSQLRMLLGISDSTLKRYITAKAVPQPEMTAPNGWPLWSDAQVRALLARRITVGRVHRHRV